MSIPAVERTVVPSATPDVEKAEMKCLQDRAQLRQKDLGEIQAPENGDESGTIDDGEADEKSSLPFSKARCIMLVVVASSASFLNILALQSAVLILPTIARDIGIPASRQQWVISSYSLAFGCFLLIWGRIADLYGRRVIFILGSALVIPATALNPLVRNEIGFDTFRGLQGFAAAANVPTAIGILGATFPPGKAKNYAFSAYASGAPLGAIIGNLFSGVIVNYTSWKWVFWILSILAGLVTIGAILYIPPSVDIARKHTPLLSLGKSVDWLGGFLITSGLIALLFALTEGNVVGWSTVWVGVLIAIAFLLIGTFAAWQWYQEKHTDRAPLIKISIFKNRMFSAVMVIMGASFAVVGNFTIYATYLWQDYQGLSPLKTMLNFLPGGIWGVIVAIIVSRLISKVPTYIMLMTGQLTLGIGCLLMAIPIPDTTSYFAYAFIALLLSVVGADTAWPCLTLFTSKSLPKEDQALGGALINASGQIGRAIGLAIGTAVQTAVMAHERGVTGQEAGTIKERDPASLRGIRAANWFSCGLALFCMVISLLVLRGTGIVGEIPKPSKGKGGQMTAVRVETALETRANTGL